jgi:hypothetical protein
MIILCRGLSNTYPFAKPKSETPSPGPFVFLASSSRRSQIGGKGRLDKG